MCVSTTFYVCPHIRHMPDAQLHTINYVVFTATRSNGREGRQGGKGVCSGRVGVISLEGKEVSQSYENSVRLYPTSRMIEIPSVSPAQSSSQLVRVE